jgi:hypothetical protein
LRKLAYQAQWPEAAAKAFPPWQSRAVAQGMPASQIHGRIPANAGIHLRALAATPA